VELLRGLRDSRANEGRHLDRVAGRLPEVAAHKVIQALGEFIAYPEGLVHQSMHDLALCLNRSTLPLFR
jgi:hypothetical protein